MLFGWDGFADYYFSVRFSLNGDFFGRCYSPFSAVTLVSALVWEGDFVSIRCGLFLFESYTGRLVRKTAHKVEDGGDGGGDDDGEHGGDSGDNEGGEQQQNNKPARASSLLQRDVETMRKLLRSNATLTSDGTLQQQQQQQHHEALQREVKAREQQLKELQAFEAEEERAGGARAAAAAGAGAGRGDAQGGGRGEARRAVRCSRFFGIALM